MTLLTAREAAAPASPAGRLEIVPVDKTTARRFVHEHHRHNEAPSVMQVMFAIGLRDANGELVGVATAGRPVARLLDDGMTLEVNRVCVIDRRNANSMLYGAVRRAAKAMGYRRLVTYTLGTESGASLRAAGFMDPQEIRIRSWQDGSKVRVRHDVTLWGERKMTQNLPKLRWDMNL